MNPPTLEALQTACIMPQKGARAYARVALQTGLEIVFIRTNGRRNEPLEAWYVSSGSENLRISEVQVETLLKLWAGTAISTIR